MKDFLDINCPETAAEVVLLQQELRGQVIIDSPFSKPDDIKIIAGVDVSHAAIVLLDAESLQPIETVLISIPTTFPYVPGPLSSRPVTK